MTQFNWIIVNLPAYPEQDGQTDVVFQVNWQCQAIADDGAANTFGSVSVTYVAGSPYTPYANLTQDQVWGWINPSINRTEIEANLQTMIDTQKAPKTVTPPLPWSN
jgi:hypothetical protein